MPPVKKEPPEPEAATLARLREIRDVQQEAVAMIPERDLLIRKAIYQEGLSQEKVADASGMPKGRVKLIAAL